MIVAVRCPRCRGTGQEPEGGADRGLVVATPACGECHGSGTIYENGPADPQPARLPGGFEG